MTLEALNKASHDTALRWLGDIYEHSPWVAEQALKHRPFATLAALKYCMAKAVEDAGTEAQETLLKAHPELAGKAMVARTLTAASTSEQQRAGLTQCTEEEFETLQRLNLAYRAQFGFPFILAVRGPRGTGLTPGQIIGHFSRRLHGTLQAERTECLRQVHRIAELRLNERFAQAPAIGDSLWDEHAHLARHTQSPDPSVLSVDYLSPAHRACATDLMERMQAAGFDEVRQDAVGNVVARYHPPQDTPDARYLLTGSHYDTVRDAGRYDGRLGILVPLAVVAALHAEKRRLPFGIEVVAFAEEEGQRFSATFLGSAALTGRFQRGWLSMADKDGHTVAQAMRAVGLPGEMDAIAAECRNPRDYLAFVELHIEQGPVLPSLNLPLGVVTSINASVRYRCEVIGTASHAGTTPMQLRQDAAAAAAEFMVFAERRATRDGDSVATVGMLHVPSGSTNVVPGRCSFSIDMRAPSDEQRDALSHDLIAELQGICIRRGVMLKLEEVMRASAAPSAPAWQAHWEAVVSEMGLPVHRMPSGAGHDAMELHHMLPQAMLFVRGENNGISHNPLESCTADDLDLAADAFRRLLHRLALEHSTTWPNT
ncbi:hypothetical protein NBRC116584_00580 [Hydrogenophaga sp. 5NK40-0174]